MTRPRLRTTATAWGAAAATGLLALGALTGPAHAAVPRPAPPAVAAPSPEPAAGALAEAVRRDLGLDAAQARLRLAREAEGARTADELRAGLGDRLAGVWFDGGTGLLQAAVADAAAADRAAAAGAVPHRVARGAGALREARATVSALIGAGVPGVAGWGVDQRANRVEVVRTVRTPQNEALAARLAAALGDAVHVADAGADAAPRQQAGDVVGGEKWVPGSESPCSVGFSVTGAGGLKGFLTAGHCTNDVSQAAYGKDGTRVGTSNKGGGRSVNAREGDMGVVDVDQAGWNVAPRVSGYGQGDVTVTGSADGIVGQAVCRSGQTSNWRCGEITKVDQSVDYGSVVVDGLSYTDACSAGGDSGGSYVSATGGRALGIHSGGGSNTCGSGGETFTIFQPVNEALAKWGLTLATAAPQPGAVTVSAVADQTSAVGEAVTLRNAASGGTAPYAWTAAGLPAGLFVDRSTGTVAGTPTAAGTSTVTVTATDGAGRSGSTTFSWTVGGGSGTPPVLQNPGSQNVTVGRPVSLRITASGGSGSRSFTATGLPAGLSIDRASGLVSGTPTTWGSRGSRITVTDGAGTTASADVTWFVFF
ncbi:putative Ig domain-containing protein [Streptomyces subrutilus]|uniref:putative Ig domain-containing protein n=1 Tax=Streptomyces subrutilus TaxID=36818 RepID=UPI002E147AE1|nr:putative Ig domain-containing protein [Streptomyces subrutilus]